MSKKKKNRKNVASQKRKKVDGGKIYPVIDSVQYNDKDIDNMVSIILESEVRRLRDKDDVDLTTMTDDELRASKDRTDKYTMGPHIRHVPPTNPAYTRRSQEQGQRHTAKYQAMDDAIAAEENSVGEKLKTAIKSLIKAGFSAMEIVTWPVRKIFGLVDDAAREKYGTGIDPYRDSVNMTKHKPLNEDSENIINFVKCMTEKNYAEANKYLQAALDGKAKGRIKRAIREN